MLEKLLSTNIMYVVLAFVILLVVIWLYNLNKDRDSTIDLADLVSVNGKLNERKLTRFGAWIVSTWGFVYLTTRDGLTEWYFIGYMGAWVANALIGKFLRDGNGDDSLPRRSRRYSNIDEQNFEYRSYDEGMDEDGGYRYSRRGIDRTQR